MLFNFVLKPKKNHMNKLYKISFILAVASLPFIAGVQNPTGKAGYTSSPGENNCTNCHNTYNANAGAGSVSITSDMVNWQYTPGTQYTINVTVAYTGKSNWGMGFEALLPSGANGGTLAAGTGTTLKNATVGGNSRRNVCQSSMATGSNSKTFTFHWTAPVAGTGNVTFYAVGLAANGTGNENGDYVYTTSQAITEAPAGVAEMEVKALEINLFPNPAVDQLNVNYALSESAKVGYIIYDLTGNVVYSKTEGRFGGNQTSHVDVSELATGAYIFTLQVNGKPQSSQRFLKK